MTGQELLDLLHRSGRRARVIGTPENGLIAGLDLEGRLFAVFDGRVLNRVVPSAIRERTNKTAYLNPGGDALWPAPEGSVFGYEYATGNWRVPPAVTGAVWEVVVQSGNEAVLRAEIDLINNSQTGIPCEFERQVAVEIRENTIIQDVTEIIRYVGTRTLTEKEFRLAPWSLCQFDVNEGAKVIMPLPSSGDIWDMYESSAACRRRNGNDYEVDVITEFRFQLGLGEQVPWIKYVFGNGFVVKRQAGPLPSGQEYIDIADIPPDRFPSGNRTSLSVYCDPSGFMEMEACGGCPRTLSPGTELSVHVVTEYSAIKKH